MSKNQDGSENIIVFLSVRNKLDRHRLQHPVVPDTRTLFFHIQEEQNLHNQKSDFDLDKVR